MKTINALISKSDINFYPEEMVNKIELKLSVDNGSFILKAPATSDNMLEIYNIFNTLSINELKGKYCRVFMDDNGNVDYIKNIVFDFPNKLINEK